jgi:hypothetical protein
MRFVERADPDFAGRTLVEIASGATRGRRKYMVKKTKLNRRTKGDAVVYGYRTGRGEKMSTAGGQGTLGGLKQQRVCRDARNCCSGAAFGSRVSPSKPHDT